MQQINQLKDMVPQVNTPQQYVELLHPVRTAKGRIAIAHRQGAEWIERSLTAAKAAVTVTDWTGQDDSYVSMNRFRGRRRMENLVGLRAVWVDLDLYKLKRWQHWSIEGVWEIAVPDYLSDAGLFQPTLAIGSGRGLYLIWLIEPIPAQALPRWNAVQKRIYEAFRGLGADRQAIDGARVLRLVGTVNSRSGQKVRVLGGDGYEWDFDALADEILPFTRTELHDLRIQRAIKKSETKPTTRRHQSLQTLWTARLSDINTLIGLRYPKGKIPSGERDGYIFMAAICMSWLSGGDGQALEQEITRFARQHTPWSDREIHSRVSAVLKRMEMVRRGLTVEWKGHLVDPRYHLRTTTIIEWLGITVQEQESMKTLIGPQEKQHRRYQSTRPEYLAQHNQERSKPWEQMGMSRRTWYDVGKPLPDTAETDEK